mmetsp:Transcript_10569/g.10582  ORF Transcript_10569/g.10582 Transcript_10569/m.10582 type:complete len:105 (-) Transcript_10569:26-340(-)
MGFPIILLGDFNCIPDSPTYNLLARHFRSAMKTVHGKEPVVTWPTELLGSKEVWGQYGEADCYDYIWFKNINVKSANIITDIKDGNICPSDHYPLEAVFDLNFD